MPEPKYWKQLRNMATQTAYVESNLRILVTSPSGRHMLWVLVEGKADPYFYERMFDSNTTMVVMVGKPDCKGVIHGGNIIVKELVKKLLAFSRNPFIIGIIDKDWRPFKKKSNLPLPENIFETDHRDLEMTLLSYQRIINVLKTEVMTSININHLVYLRKDKNTDWFRDVWIRCCNVSRYMGIFHIIASHFKTSDVCFTIPCYWEEKNHCLFPKWKDRLFITAIKQCKISKLRLSIYRCWINLRYCPSRRPFFDVCRGHDFLSVLSCMLIDKSHFSEEWMTFFMTNEISKQEIKSMQLYAHIGRWMNKKDISFFAI